MSVDNNVHLRASEEFKTAAKTVMDDDYSIRFSRIYEGIFLLLNPSIDTFPFDDEKQNKFIRATVNTEYSSKQNESLIFMAWDHFRESINLYSTSVKYYFKDRRGPWMEETKARLEWINENLPKIDGYLALNPTPLSKDKVASLIETRKRCVETKNELESKIKQKDELDQIIGKFILETQQLLGKFETVKEDLFTAIKGRNIFFAPSDSAVRQVISNIEEYIKTDLCPFYGVTMSAEEAHVEGPSEPCSSSSSVPQPEVVKDENCDPFLAELKGRLRTRK